MARHKKTKGVILRREDFGEADKILTIYTKDLGKIRPKARGVRKSTAKLAGHLELFNHVDLVLAGGTIIGAVTINHFEHLRDNLDNLEKAAYISEMIDRFSPEEDPDERLFNLVLESLTKLDLDYFERKFLDLLGFGGVRPKNIKRFLQEALT